MEGFYVIFGTNGIWAAGELVGQVGANMDRYGSFYVFQCTQYARDHGFLHGRVESEDFDNWFSVDGYSTGVKLPVSEWPQSEAAFIELISAYAPEGWNA